MTGSEEGAEGHRRTLNDMRKRKQRRNVAAGTGSVAKLEPSGPFVLEEERVLSLLYTQRGQTGV